MKNQPHPFQYQGSKRNLAGAILEYFPEKPGRLIEPFAGSAAISIAAASKNLTDRFLLNDLNMPLIELLQQIVEKPKETSDSYEEIWNAQFLDSENHYYQIRKEFNNLRNPVLFLYLLSRCVKGAVRYNSEGQFNQSPDKRRFGTRPSTLRKSLFSISSLLKGKTVFSSVGYEELNSVITTNDLVYMDPPYEGVCGNRDSRYFSGISRNTFVDFLSELNQKNIMYVVSYDGRTGDKVFGNHLPEHLNLKRVEVNAGRSSQSTLFGKSEVTYESLYISKPLSARLSPKKSRTITRSEHYAVSL